MNCLILVNQAPDYYYFYNQLAYSLNKYDVNVFFAFTSKLPEQLYNVEKNKFEKIYFTEYLSSFNGKEKVMPSKYTKYNIWESFFSDFERYQILGYHLDNPKQKYNDIVNKLYCFFDELVDNKGIDFIIYEDVSNSFAYAAYNVAQEYGIKYYGLSFPRIPGRYEIIEGPRGNRSVMGKVFNEILNDSSSSIKLKSELVDYADNYLSNFIVSTPTYMVNNPLSPNYSVFKRYVNVKRLQYFYKLLKYKILYNKDNEFNYQASVFKWNISLFTWNVKRKIKNKLLNKYFDLIDENDVYHLYPIHFHPEASTSVLAKTFVNEYNNILNISLNIPFGEYLYVKEHISNIGYPSLEFYKNVLKIPNVKLLNPNYNAKELIKRCKSVITITSTVGFEAIILNKPVFVFGDVFYDFHPLCTKLKSYDELFVLLNSMPKVNIEYDPKKFIYAYLLSTYDGVIKYQPEYDVNDLQFIDSVARNVINIFQETILCIE